MSFRLSFHQPLLGLSGADWLDDPPDLNCKDSARQHAVDEPLLSCNLLPDPLTSGFRARALQYRGDEPTHAPGV